jgi:cytochrome P450
VNSAFSMTALVHYEPLVEDILELFLDKTELLYATPGKACNFSRWLQYYAFDVIGQITYSRRHGFIDDDTDIDGIVQNLGSIFNYVAPVGQMPWLDLILLKNPIILLLDKLGLRFFQFPVATFAKQRMTERLKVPEKLRADGGEHASQRPDLLSRFLKAKEDRPEVMDDTRVLTMAVSMAFAGSETTAISLSAVFYYLLKNPRCYRKLQEEIDLAVLNGSVVDRRGGTLTWAEVQTLPYLDACIKEAFRLHPAAGLPLERITPPQGVEIDGHLIPGGTIVGCNAWVIHRCGQTFGDKVDDYIPERWIVSPPERLKEMNATMFQFGAGSRTCIGKNISLLEIYKLVPSFLRRFEVS